MDDINLLTVLSPDCDPARDDVLWTLELEQSAKRDDRLIVTVGGERLEPLPVTHHGVELSAPLAVEVAMTLLRWAAPQMPLGAVFKLLGDLMSDLRVAAINPKEQ